MYFRIIFLMLISVTLHAQVEDKWKINLGTMFVTNFETDMQLSPKNLPIGVKINSKDQLGLKNDTNVFRLDGYYRFTDSQSMDFSYFSVKSDGQRTIDQEFNWDGNTIPVGANISSYFNMDIYKINYLYSFYHSDKVELALSAGFHITSLSLGLSADALVDGAYQKLANTNTSVTLPLPVFGFKGQYTIIDKKLFVEYRTDYFLLEYDNYKGNLVTTALSLEYRFLEHVGVGLGFNSNKIYLQVDDGDNRVEVSNNLSGVMLYLSYTY